MKRQVVHAVTIAFCVLLSALAIRGTLDPITYRLGTGTINAHNSEYLDKTFNKALVGFGVMSGIKVGLAIIEGSTLGVSAGATINLQVGDVVQSAYDYVDIAWRTLLLGCISILSIQYLLRAASVVDGWVLGFTLIAFAVHLLLCWWAPSRVRIRQTVRDVLSVSVVATLAIFYILPLSVWGASHLSRIITQPSIEEAHSGFSDTRSTLFPDDESTSDGVFARIRQIPERIQQIGVHLKNRSKDMAIWTIKLIAGYIFDCVVFPVGMFVLLLWMTRSVMKYIFHRNLQSSLRQDMSRLLIKQRVETNG